MRKQESEKTLEARLVKEVKAMGGMAVKHTSQFHRGMPDRIVLMPGGLVYFVEMKSTGKKPEGLQDLAHRQLRAMGFAVVVIDTSDMLEAFLWSAREDMALRRCQR